MNHSWTFPQPPSVLDSFLFLLLTRRLGLNYPAAVLIVWIVGRKQRRGYRINGVGEDVAATG